MQSPVLSSTFFLTLLMMIGLVFFIRASTKERIEVVRLAIAQSPQTAIDQLQQYFQQRSYYLVETDLAKNKQVFEGFVRPSIFLAVLLFVLAAVGCLCLGLVLSLLLPEWNPFVWVVVLLAPAASLFYWKKSSRLEQVSFKVESLAAGSDTSESSKDAVQSNQEQSCVTVMGHRDELASLQDVLKQQAVAFHLLD
ncbi:MAG: cofactor assembly of complex C subunit B [Cyanothece sp. SIO2G6]|nr:cofactor assembly of complex C subunit B [Cyanothece sp. SIO2G6]